MLTVWLSDSIAPTTNPAAVSTGETEAPALAATFAGSATAFGALAVAVLAAFDAAARRSAGLILVSSVVLIALLSQDLPTLETAFCRSDHKRPGYRLFRRHQSGTVVVPFRYQRCEEAAMPALNVEFTDDELASVRVAASDAGTSMRAFAKQAILDRAADREGQVRALSREIAERSEELNRRLA